MENSEIKSTKNIYDKCYKIIILIPLILFIISIIYIYTFYQQNGDFINKDISLTGGTSITVNSAVDLTELKQFLSTKFSDFNVREVSDLTTGEQLAFIVEVPEEQAVVKSALENYLGFELTEENSSIEFTGSSLSGSFYSQLKFAILISFILMSIVVLIIFRTFVPSLIVVYCAFVDIVMTLAVVDLVGMKISSAGIVAFLMLIGYSVDSDILLTTRVLRRKENANLNSIIYGAFKTGITMTLTSLVAVLVCLFITRNLSGILSQIFTILSIGLSFDIFNTWITNASIIKWYAESKIKWN